MSKFLPLVLFAVVVYFLLDGLGRDPKKLPSPLIGKAFPNIEVVDFHTGEKYFIKDKLHNKTSVVNVWASWCVTCHFEHSTLNEIAKNQKIQMVGINYKDDKKSKKCLLENRDDTKFGDCFLQMRGNPFDFVVFDKLGKLGLELGVYRVPETFLVNQKGIIIFKHLGEITPSIWQEKFAPKI